MRPQHEALQRLIEPAVKVLGYELVGIEYLPHGTQTLMRVYIDSEEGISVRDCERVSHQISGVLDVHDPIPSRYTLEVSSPGINRPLFAASDFERFKGRRVSVKLRTPLHGQRNFNGMLLGCGEGVVRVHAEGIEHLLPLEQIGTARLVPEL
ncbi:MAG: ribosome maturation factor RimP [Gammaproteobacteria bacterium]